MTLKLSVLYCDITCMEFNLLFLAASSKPERQPYKSCTLELLWSVICGLKTLLDDV